MAVVYRCDRCRKEVDASSLTSLLRQVSVSGITVPYCDLCETCIKTLKQWIAEPPVREMPR